MQKYWEEKEREWNILIEGVQFTTEEIWWIRLVDQYKWPFYMNGKNSSCQFLHSDIECGVNSIVTTKKWVLTLSPDSYSHFLCTTFHRQTLFQINIFWCCNSVPHCQPKHKKICLKHLIIKVWKLTWLTIPSYRRILAIAKFIKSIYWKTLTELTCLGTYTILEHEIVHSLSQGVNPFFWGGLNKDNIT